jgi:uncharacterized membrane protein SirB2
LDRLYTWIGIEIFGVAVFVAVGLLWWRAGHQGYPRFPKEKYRSALFILTALIFITAIRLQLHKYR